MATSAPISGRWAGGGASERARPTGLAPNPPHPSESWDVVLAVVRAHGASLLRIARRHSICGDDAQDAYQRGLEIFLRRVDSLEPETMASWLRTVVKHEAMAVRAAREALVEAGDVDLDLHEDHRQAPVEERVASFERVHRAAEALRRCKPDEARALVLKAQGHSYAEIGELTGWSPTKVNRVLTEGRRVFMARYAGIESGAECERWSPVVVAIADGEAAAADVVEARPHLRACSACRARVREYRWAAAQVAALVPLPPLAEAASGPHGVPAVALRLYEALTGGLHERVLPLAHRIQSTLEAASAGKVTALAASTAALAGGGVAVQAALDRPGTHALRVQARARARPAHERRPRAAAAPPASAPAPVQVAPLAPTPPAAAPVRPLRVTPLARRHSVEPAQGAPAPVSPAVAPTTQEFGPEQSSGSATTRSSVSGSSTASSSVSGHSTASSSQPTRGAGRATGDDTASREFGP